MPAPLPYALRQRILKLGIWLQQNSETLSYERKARRLLVSVDSVQKYVKLFKRTGSKNIL